MQAFHLLQDATGKTTWNLSRKLALACPVRAFKRHFSRSRRPRFPRILSGLSVSDCQTSLGAKGSRLFAFGPGSAELFVAGPRVRDFLALGKPRMGTWQVSARSGSKSTLSKMSFKRKSQAKIFKNSGSAVLDCQPRLGDTSYETSRFQDAQCRTFRSPPHKRAQSGAFEAPRCETFSLRGAMA